MLGRKKYIKLTISAWSHSFEVEIAIAKLKKCKLPGSNQSGRTASSRKGSILVQDPKLINSNLESGNQWKGPNSLQERL
jgi:hypothetical protein